MNQTTNTQKQRISAKQLRKFLNSLVDDICTAQDRLDFAIRGNSFRLYLQGGSINITINEPKKGGQK